MFEYRYYIEDIYELVGLEDRVASISFLPDSESFRLYGNHITAVFLYTQKERLCLDERIKDKENKTADYAKVKYLGDRLDKDSLNQLEKNGIYCEDIASVMTLPGFDRNTFHSDKKREITTLEIPIYSEAKGRDYDWIYGFSKQQVADGVTFCPQERIFYLSCKYYYEPQNITDEEKLEMFEGEHLKQLMQFEYLKIKYRREEITMDENKILNVLYLKNKQDCKDILEKYLNQSGSSIKKLANENIELYIDLMQSVLLFKEIRLNVNTQHPIYLDLEGYLHIFMRHVAEMKVNEQFAHKDNFQWDLDDVITVIKHVVEDVENEAQDFFENNKGKQYCKFGDQAVYFEGDYYAVYIADNGRLQSLFKIKKK